MEQVLFTNPTANEISFVKWQGELGWEIMRWVPYCRYQALGYQKVSCSSFIDMRYLYKDFCTEFRPHDGRRGLDYPKMYRLPQGVHVKYGAAEKSHKKYDVLIHARGISRKANINYQHWIKIMGGMAHINFACIGSKDDQCCGVDCTNLPLDKLCNLISAAKLVIGCSSGVMHLAAACGTDLVCWGDDRTYFNETLEKRYKQTWNPHHVNVNWITAKDWQPEPSQILKAIEKGLQK